MATAQQAALQLRNFGNIDPARNAESNKKSEWEKLLAQMAMAQKMDARTMAGFALGKLLRGGYDTWLANKRAKEQINDKDNFNNRNQTPTSSPANFDSLPEVSALSKILNCSAITSLKPQTPILTKLGSKICLAVGEVGKMAFDFNVSPQMQQLFDTIKQQSQQELPDAKQRIDNAILSATMPQVPNQHQQGFEQRLLLMKSLYDAAKDDEQRQAIHKQAENLRNVGNAAGYDLSGYGSGVTFADATQNLATQQSA